MATYKVLQDIEAEDKLIGPLTLRQFIYAGIAAVSLYVGFVCVSKGLGFMAVLFVPVAATTGFFAFPWGKDQPTELWALAKIRFLFKPRKRIWDQSGVKELVTITVPKQVERVLTNGLNQDQVRSRLAALASTIDSRGWAVKNVNVNLNSGAATYPAGSSDRLVQGSSLPQEVSDVDVRASDDMLDAANNPIAQQFDHMITAASAAHRQQLLAQMQQPAGSMPAPMPAPVSAAPALTPTSAAAVQPQGQPADYWFMHPVTTVPGQATFVDTPVITPGAQAAPVSLPQAATPTADEEALLAKLKTAESHQSAAYGHMKTLKTPEQLQAEAAAAQLAAQQAAQASAQATAAAKAQVVTPAAQAVILDLSNNDDLDVATIARQAHKAQQSFDEEVVISLR